MKMISIPAAVILLGACPACLSANDDEARDIPRSVVKIFTTHRYPDLLHPWRKQDAQESTGTGVIIEGRRVLTNAHMALYCSQVFVQPHRSADKIRATVEAIAPDIDLAVLKVADPGFFEKHPPLPRASKIPSTKDAIHVFGYPEGGEAISITKGVVSRIEFTDYFFSLQGLRIQVDAAINPGNSGGPAVVGDRMVGIIFSRLQESDNIGYIIPNEEIDLFLADIADGHYDGKPVMDDKIQYAQNEALRRRLKLGPDTSGVIVRRPVRSDPSYPLRRWDLITKIGENTIDNSWMAEADSDLRLDFRYYVQKLARDGKVPLEIVREGKGIHVDLPVPDATKRPRLIPFLYDKYPSYAVWGPLVFSSASNNYIKSFEGVGMAESWFPFFARNESPLLESYEREPRFEGEQLVVVLAMLAHPLAKGYNDPSSFVVDEINGVKVRNLAHLAELLRDARDEFVVITFRDRYSDVMVFDRKQVEAASEEILSENGIRKPCSDDLKSVFAPK